MFLFFFKSNLHESIKCQQIIFQAFLCCHCRQSKTCVKSLKLEIPPKDGEPWMSNTPHCCLENPTIQQHIWYPILWHMRHECMHMLQRVHAFIICVQLTLDFSAIGSSHIIPLNGKNKEVDTTCPLSLLLSLPLVLICRLTSPHQSSVALWLAIRDLFLSQGRSAALTFSLREIADQRAALQTRSCVFLTCPSSSYSSPTTAREAWEFYRV